MLNMSRGERERERERGVRDGVGDKLGDGIRVRVDINRSKDSSQRGRGGGIAWRVEGAKVKK